MKPMDRYIIERQRNIVRVDFGREPDPPAPKFPGAAALRRTAQSLPSQQYHSERRTTIGGEATGSIELMMAYADGANRKAR